MVGAARPGELRQIVVLREFAALLEGSELDCGREYIVERRQFERELENDAFNRDLRKAAQPLPADLRSYYEKHIERYTKPKRWKLRNIHVSSSSADPRRTIEKVAAELKAGSAFEELVATYSESATAAREGRMGFVTLDELVPEVATVVEDLEVGGVSDVIETKDGFTILECTHVLHAGATSLEAIEKRVEAAALRERYQSSLDAVHERIRAESSLVPLRRDWLATDPISSPVLVLRLQGEEDEKIGLDEYFQFLRARGGDSDPTAVSEAEHLNHLDGLLIEIGMAREAKRRGLLDTNEYRESLNWNLKVLAAHVVFRQRMEPDPVSAEEIAAFYKKHRSRFARPAASHLFAVEIKLIDSTSRSMVERARQAVARLKDGDLRIGEAAAFVDPVGTHVRFSELGWISHDQMFLLGAGAEEAGNVLGSGETSDLIQEGPVLMILHCDATRERSPLSPDEVRPAIIRQLEENHRRRAKRRFEEQLLREAGFTIVAPDEPNPSAEETGAVGGES